jgi:predicted anti-sigma-YlaC factor YlaD
MECRKIRASLVSLLEDRLSGEQQAGVEHHLRTCPGCQRLLREFSFLWGELEHPPRIQSSPWFWTRLSRKLTECEEQDKPLREWLRKLAHRARPAIASAAILACVFLGYWLGSFPQQANGQTASGLDQHTVALKQFFESYHLDEVSTSSMEATYQKLVGEE